MTNLFKEWSDLREEVKNTFLHKLGPLAYLVGVWEGTGFTVISRPSPQPNQIFQFQTNKTQETLSITPLILSVTNRGENPQPDIKLNGIFYSQAIVDAENITNVLHFESGQWLLVPITKNPDSKMTIVRQATILHGVTFLATGDAPGLDRNAGKPNIDPTDVTPVLLSGGPLDDDYLTQITCTKPPSGFPEGSVKDPNLVLTNRLLTQDVLDYVRFSVVAKLHGPDAPSTGPNVGGSGDANSSGSNLTLGTHA